MPWVVRAKMSLGYKEDKYQLNGWFQKLSMRQNEKHYMRTNFNIENFNLVSQNNTEYGIKFQFCQKCYKCFIAFHADEKK
jgi:hypothetical protein